MKKTLLLATLMLTASISQAAERYQDCFNDALKNWRLFSTGQNVKSQAYKTCCLNRNGEEFCTNNRDEKYCYSYGELQMTAAIGKDSSEFMKIGDSIYRECKKLNPTPEELASAKRTLERESYCYYTNETLSLCRE